MLFRSGTRLPMASPVASSPSLVSATTTTRINHCPNCSILISHAQMRHGRWEYFDWPFCFLHKCRSLMIEPFFPVG